VRKETKDIEDGLELLKKESSSLFIVGASQQVQEVQQNQQIQQEQPE